MQSYATNQDDLDRAEALQTEVRNVAVALARRGRQIRTGKYQSHDAGRPEPRPK